ncbi:MAG: PorT family protein [Flavobacteriaceae bacterium]|nr:MAG: PorT family protein [Flavobacteriaceae bacterium]
MVNNKFYFTLFLTLFLGASVYSQVLIAAVFGDKLNSPDLEFGLEGGYNWSDISELNNGKNLSEFNLGFYFDIRLKDQWFFYTGVLVKGRLGAGELSSDDLSLLGITIQDEEGTYDQKISYFMVPALIKYRFRNRVYLELGPQFGLRHKAFVEFTAEEGDIEFRTRQNNKDAINRLGAGLTFGTGYRLSDKAAGITLGLKYYYGFTNVYKDISGPKNSSLFLKCNIPIGVKKSQELRKQKALEKENDLKKE